MQAAATKSQAWIAMIVATCGSVLPVTYLGSTSPHVLADERRPHEAVLQSQSKTHSKRARFSNYHASSQANDGALPRNAAPRAHQHTSSSLKQAWGRIRRVIPEKSKGAPQSIDKRVLQRFLGFLEGRLRVTLPKQWDQSVGQARAFHRDNVVFDIDRSRRLKRGAHGFYLDRQNELQIRQHDAALVVDRKSIRIPADAYTFLRLKRQKLRCTHLAALASDDKCYIASYANTGTPFVILCLNRTSNKIDWQSEGKGSGIGAYLGVGSHAVYLAENDDSIVVFGVEGVSIHVEGFDKKTGQSLFSFSSAATAQE